MLWEEFPEVMMRALGQHDYIIDQAVDANHGVSVKPRGEGDSRFLVFQDAADGVSAAKDIQLGLINVVWPTPTPLLVRIAIHTGVADLRSGDYYGSAVNRAARLRALAHGGQTVVSAATCELVKDSLPPGATLRDMGQHGLKDLTRPEHVFQVDIEGLANSFPPLKSLEATPNNLPIQLTEFVGREGEIEDLELALQESRLVTILAPGGAGKTRLAIQVAADLTGDFPDGVFFVDLAPVASVSEIPQTIFESVGVPIASGDEMRLQLLAYLANKKQLLVMDNFEHLLDGADLVSEILTSTPGVRVIATSRARLRITGESVLALSGLESDWESLDEAVEMSSVQLFLDAARRANRSFTPSESDFEPLGRIIELVEGMPLGILLAAAWVDTLGVEEIASEITRNLDFLESDRRDTPDRHRSMRAVFEYSLSLLGDEERRMFSALSVFRGGFTRDAAERVAAASLRNLANLANKSLLSADRGTGRYSIHELLRQYAEELLMEEKALNQSLHEPTAAAYVDYFSGLGGESEEMILTGSQQRALAILEEDIDNVRSAWRQSIERGDVIAVRRFVIGLWFLHEVRGWHQAAQALFTQALEAIPEGSLDEATVIAREAVAGAQGKFISYLGSPAEGAEMSEQAAERLSQTSDRYAELMALEARCDGLAYLGDWEEIRAVAIKAINIAEKNDVKWWRAGMPNWLGIAEAQLGNVEPALAAVDDGYQRLTDLGDEFFVAWNVMVKATMEAMAGQLDEAAASNSQLVDLSRGLGFQRTLQFGLQGLGDVKAAAGDLPAAQDAYLECLKASEKMGAVVEIAGMMVRIANVRAGMGLTENAVELLACVVADPVAKQKMINETETIRELAEKSLPPLQESLETKSFEAARARGSAKTLEVAAKALLAG